MFISVDQEGMVTRIYLMGRQLSSLGSDDDWQLIMLNRAYLMVSLHGARSPWKHLGINMNLAPVLDVNNNPEKSSYRC